MFIKINNRKYKYLCELYNAFTCLCNSGMDETSHLCENNRLLCRLPFPTGLFKYNYETAVQLWYTVCSKRF